MTVIDGIGVAVPTFIDEIGVIAEKDHEQLAQHLASHGAARILVAGTTGRGATLGRRQRNALVKASSRAGIPIWCGVSPRWARNGLAELREAGADAVLVGWEEGSRLDDVLELHQHTQEHGMRLVTYHHPREGHLIPDAWYQTLAENDILVKNSAGDTGSVSAMTAAGLRVHIGATGVISQAATLGAAGVLSGLAAIRLADVLLAAAGDQDANRRLTAWEESNRDCRIAVITRDAQTMITAHPSRTQRSNVEHEQ